MIQLRRALSTDVGRIHALHGAAVRAGFRGHYDAPTIEAVTGARGIAAWDVDVALYDVFVAEDGDRLCGVAAVAAERAEVCALYVDPDEGSRGLGRRLLELVETTARLRGLESVWLDASLNAVEFYRAAGWAGAAETTRTLPGYTIQCIRMEKRLPPLRLALRDETVGDVAAVRAVNDAAFGREGEGVLVDRLRSAGALTLSLVAVLDDAVVGHVGMSPVTVDGAAGSVLGLGPMAVLPVHQRAGIGSRLGEEALARAREHGHAAVVVLGHPELYPRFGFVPASRFGLRFGATVPDEAFMAVELVPGALAGAAGVVRYRPEFDEVEE